MKRLRSARMSRGNRVTKTTRSSTNGRNAQTHEQNHQKYQPETGTHVKYSILEMRQYHARLQKWYEQRWPKHKQQPDQLNTT